MHINNEVSLLKEQISKMSDLLQAERAAKILLKNMDFEQVPISEMRSIAELGRTSPLALELLIIFTQIMDKQNAVMMSYETMECISKKSRRQLSRAVGILKSKNWIQVIKVGTANAYILNTAAFWTDKGDKRRFGKFTAKIITTLEEQQKDLRKSPSVKLKRMPLLESKKEKLIIENDDLLLPDQKDRESAIKRSSNIKRQME